MFIRDSRPKEKVIQNRTRDRLTFFTIGEGHQKSPMVNMVWENFTGCESLSDQLLLR